MQSPVPELSPPHAKRPRDESIQEIFSLSCKEKIEFRNWVLKGRKLGHDNEGAQIVLKLEAGTSHTGIWFKFKLAAEKTGKERG